MHVQPTAFKASATQRFSDLATSPYDQEGCDKPSDIPIADLVSLYEKLSGWRLTVVIDDNGSGALVKGDRDYPRGECPAWLYTFINDNTKAVAAHIRDTRGYIAFRPDCGAEFIPPLTGAKDLQSSARA